MTKLLNFIFVSVGIIVSRHSSHRHCTKAFTTCPQRVVSKVSRIHHQFQMKHGTGNSEDKDETKEPPMSLAELSRLEEEVSRKNLDSLLVPSRIGKAITNVGWLFVISGFVLNLLGYGYVVQPNHLIKIDTLENRQFQMEMRRSVREDTRQQIVQERK